MKEKQVWAVERQLGTAARVSPNARALRLFASSSPRLRPPPYRWPCQGLVSPAIRSQCPMRAAVWRCPFPHYLSSFAILISHIPPRVGLPCYDGPACPTSLRAPRLLSSANIAFYLWNSPLRRCDNLSCRVFVSTAFPLRHGGDVLGAPRPPAILFAG